MALRYGIDTSVLVRLITGEPPDAFAHCVERLNALVILPLSCENALICGDGLQAAFIT